LSYQANQVLSTFWLLGKATREKINAIYILDPKVVSLTTTLQECLEEHTCWICLLSALLYIRLENQWWLFLPLADAWKLGSGIQGFISWTLYKPLGYCLWGKENKEGDSLRKKSCEQETRSMVGLIVKVPEGSKL
jgi:hypothetical protein